MDYRNTEVWRITVVFDESREVSTERIEKDHRITVKRNGEATFRHWAKQTLAVLGRGRYCPDFLDYPTTKPHVCWLYDNETTAYDVYSQLTESLIAKCYTQEITLQAPLADILNAEVLIHKATLPGNLISDFFQDRRKTLMVGRPVSTDKLLQMIADDRITVARFEFSSNSHGEFWFIDLIHETYFTYGTDAGPVHMQWYGMGENWNSGRYISNWQDISWNQWLYGKVIPEDKSKVFAKIKSLAENIPQEKPQTNRQTLYEMIAEMTDEDGAITFMEDYNL
jgi:hypothetical protein